MVQEYGFDEIQDLTFDDGSLFTGSSIDVFMDDMVGLPSEIDDMQCFDSEFPFDMPLLMQSDEKKELDCRGNA